MVARVSGGVDDSAPLRPDRPSVRDPAVLEVQLSLVEGAPTLPAGLVELIFYFLPSGPRCPVLLSLFYDNLLSRRPVPFLILLRLLSFVLVLLCAMWSFWDWGFVYGPRAL